MPPDREEPVHGFATPAVPTGSPAAGKPPTLRRVMLISTHLRPELAFLIRDPIDRAGLFRHLGEAVSALTGVPAREVEGGLADREAQCSTAIGSGVALPHALVTGIPEPLVASVMLPDGVEFAPGTPPVRLVFAIFGSPDNPWQHVRMLARLARIVSAEGAVERLLRSGTAIDLYERLRLEDASHG